MLSCLLSFISSSSSPISLSWSRCNTALIYPPFVPYSPIYFLALGGSFDCAGSMHQVVMYTKKAYLFSLFLLLVLVLFFLYVRWVRFRLTFQLSLAETRSTQNLVWLPLTTSDEKRQTRVSLGLTYCAMRHWNDDSDYFSIFFSFPFRSSDSPCQVLWIQSHYW